MSFAKGYYGKIIKIAFIQLIYTMVGTIITISFAVMLHMMINKELVLIFNSIEQILLTIGICILLQFFLHKYKATEAEKTGVLIKDDIRSKLLQKLFMMGPAYMNDNRTGDVASAVTSRVEWLKRYFTNYLPVALGSIINLIIILIIMFTIDWATALVCLIAAIGMLICPMCFYEIMTGKGKKEWEEHSKYYSDCLDGIQGVSSLKAFNANDKQIKKMKIRGEEFRTAIMNHLKITIIEGSVLELFARVGGALSVAVAAIRFSKGYIDSTIIVYLFYMAMACFNPMISLINAWHIGFQGIAASYSISEIMNSRTDFPLYGKNTLELINHLELQEYLSKHKDNGYCINKVDRNFDGDVSFKNVFFSYNKKDGNVLENINFTIPAGNMMALVGPSGGGKSTIAQLLAGFYPINSGTISVGKDKLTVNTVETIQNRISAVWQDSYLIFGTVYDNILIGNPEATKEDVYEAAQKANIHDFIMRLPKGYDTLIGERGMRFSGGERQRISIARAYLRNSPILIFDEATSSLDRKNELEIQNSFTELRRGKTALVIAHRLATIKNADIICILDGGKIVETGTHEQLINSSERYIKLMGDQIVKRGAVVG